MVLILFAAGCGSQGGGSDASREDSQDESIKNLIQQNAERDKKDAELKNSLKGKEFRGLSLGIPLGGGKLRIVVPEDDEGNQVFAPSEVRDAFLQEADRLRRDPPIAPDLNNFVPPAPGKDRIPPLQQHVGRKQPAT